MVPSMCTKCQRTVIEYNIYEAILEKKPDNKSQNRGTFAVLGGGGGWRKHCEVARSDREGHKKDFKI